MSEVGQSAEIASRRPRLLDLYCCQGGAAMGYRRAGWDVVGVDTVDQSKRYPFEFHQADAIEYLEEHWPEFDAVHASPPCKAFTKTGWAFKYGYHKNHADLVGPTREALDKLPLPYIIENVPGAPVRPDVILCGSHFGLNLRRHRWFELSFPTSPLTHSCEHRRGVASPHGKARRPGEAKEWAAALEIDWMNEGGLSQAIPPAYTEHLGRLLLDEVRVAFSPAQEGR